MIESLQNLELSNNFSKTFKDSNRILISNRKSLKEFENIEK